MCKAGYPEGIDKEIGLIVLILNILAPGFGTWVAAGAGNKCDGKTVAIGFAHFFTSLLLVGWVWAIIWSIGLYKKAKEEEEGGGVKGMGAGQGVPAPVTAPAPAAAPAPNAGMAAPPPPPPPPPPSAPPAPHAGYHA